MDPFPHRYRVAVSAAPQSAVRLDFDGGAPIASLPPAEFGGPGGRWSPETLLTAALGDCFALSFEVIAEASRCSWSTLHCDVEGTLDRVDRQMRFTRFVIRTQLTIAHDDLRRAQRCLDKAKDACLVSNSLNAEVELETEIVRDACDNAAG